MAYNFGGAIMKRYLVALAILVVCAATLHADTGTKPRGQPQNAWRYVLYNGRWWYWTPDDQWALYNGRRWVTFQPHLIGSSLAGEGTQAGGRSPQDDEPTRFYNSLDANTRSLLESTRPQSPLPAATGTTSSADAFGGGIGRSTLGTGVDVGARRSGDAGSGVGGGTVGGTSVSGGAAGSSR
jgi:hypothetical protein